MASTKSRPSLFQMNNSFLYIYQNGLWALDITSWMLCEVVLRQLVLSITSAGHHVHNRCLGLGAELLEPVQEFLRMAPNRRPSFHR